MKTLIKILKWLPAIFIFSCSWYLSSQEHIDGIPSFWNADKLVHCICFAGLSFWVAFGWNNKDSNTHESFCNRSDAETSLTESTRFQKLSPYLKFIVPVAIVSIYGIVDEIHQSFTPGRESSVLDWVADTIGAVIGVFVFRFVVSFIEKHLVSQN